MGFVRLLIIFILLTVSFVSQSQQTDSISKNISDIPDKYYSTVDKKVKSVNDKLTRKSLKYLAKFQRQESRLQQKLQKLHPEFIIDSASEKYSELAQKLKSKATGAAMLSNGLYNPYLDSLGTSLSFLKQLNGMSEKVSGPLQSFKGLQDKLQQSDKVKQFIAERKDQIKTFLLKYTNLPAGIKNEYANLNKTAYYYSAQVSEYKETLKDPDKIEQKTLGILRELPAFQKFMKQNSQLGNLFGIPADYGNSTALQGLQTVDQVQQLIRSRIGSGPNANQMLHQQMQAAQSQLSQFKDKLSKLGGGSADIEMPDFKPNSQKTKPFLQRLEYGCNLQTTKGTYNFPSTSDIGLSAGYKLNNKSTVGIGVSYKAGWGRNIQHIHISSQGVGLRSFFDYKLKKTFSASGGFEYNYQQPFNSTQQLYQINDWQKSGLIGITKEIELKTKTFKKTKVQLLWDLLSYTKTVRTNPLKFRIGYNF